MNNNNFLKFCLFLLLSLASVAFFSCEKNNETPKGGDDVSQDTGHPLFSGKGWYVDGKDVYMIVDYVSNDLRYYKNDNPIVLAPITFNYRSKLEDIFVVGKDVYAVGTLGQSTSTISHQAVAYYWVNGVKTALTVPNPPEMGIYPNVKEFVVAETFAYRVVVEHNNVYVWGGVKWYGKLQSQISDEVFDLDIWIPGYWRNNAFIPLQMPEGEDFGLITLQDIEQGSIAVSNGDVYIVNGRRNGYWKNGIFVLKLPTLHNTESYYDEVSIGVAGSVYIAGNQYSYPNYQNSQTIACYWKDGVRFDLWGETSGYTKVSGLVVVGNDVYVSGHISTPEYTDTYAVYWKNNEYKTLPVKQADNIRSYTLGMYTSNNDVYILGSDNKGLCYWKNGKQYYYQDYMYQP